MRLPQPDRWCRAQRSAWLRQTGSRRNGRSRAVLRGRLLRLSAGSAWPACIGRPLWLAWPSGLGPAARGVIVVSAGLDPVVAALAFLVLPSRAACLEIVHQEFGGLERGLAVARGGYHQHDILAGRDATGAVDDGQPVQRPARHRLLGVAGDLGFRHPGIMFERERADRIAVFAAPAD